MVIKARKLKEPEFPEKTALYEVSNSCDILVEERQSDSKDQVIMKYSLKDCEVGYFAKEYRPGHIPKTGAKVIDITAAVLNHADKYIRWYLYDVKDTLAGENTVIKLYNQWNAGLGYLKQTILGQIPEYSQYPDLGVITRCYDEERMKRLRDDYQEHCDAIEKNGESRTLAQRKKRTDIVKYRAVRTAAQAILDRKFQAEDGSDTYEIHIRHLLYETDRVYKLAFFV